MARGRVLFDTHVRVWPYLGDERYVERQRVHRGYEAYTGGDLGQGGDDGHGFEGDIPVLRGPPKPAPFGHRQEKIEPDLLCQDRHLAIVSIGRWHRWGGRGANLSP